jgi:hypothetical protein
MLTVLGGLAEFERSLIMARWAREKVFSEMKDLTMLEILNERHGLKNGAP